MTLLDDRADARNSAVAPTFTVVSPTGHDRIWWAAEAARTGTDWRSLADAALEAVASVGILGPEPDAMTSWHAPSWRLAAVEYHKDRPGRLAVEIEPKRLARLRQFMADHVSLERAWFELRDNYPNAFQKGHSR